MDNVIEDAQTAVTSLAGAIAGAASDKVANTIISYARLGKNTSGLGDTGLRFIIRAGVTSVMFAGVAGAMPETSSNVFFSILFFAANRALVNDGVHFANLVVKGTSGMLNLQPKAIKTPPTGAAVGSCCNSCASK